METPGHVDAPSLVFHQSDSGHPLEVPVGATFALELRDASTTGYRWAVEELDERVLDLAGSRVRPGGGIGATGTITFVFKAKAPGAARLRLKLWRSWVGDASIVERFDAPLQLR
jgi:inhibitor of cysteine peptidase